jgi:hypothetical protein
VLSKPHPSVLNFLPAQIPLDVRPGIIRHSASRIDHCKVIFLARKIASKIMNKLLLVSARSNRGFCRIWAWYFWYNITVVCGGDWIIPEVVILPLLKAQRACVFCVYSVQNGRRTLPRKILVLGRLFTSRNSRGNMRDMRIMRVIMASLCRPCELKTLNKSCYTRFLFQPPVKQSLVLRRAITFYYRQRWYNVVCTQQEANLVWFFEGNICNLKDIHKYHID